MNSKPVFKSDAAPHRAHRHTRGWIVALLVAAALGSPVTAAARIPGSLIEALAALPAGAEVIAATSAYQAALLDAEAAGYRGDTAFTLTPSYKRSWLPGADVDPYGEVTATLGATIPLGLSGVDKLRLERAVTRVETAEADLRSAVLDAVASLSASYSRALLSVAELPVLAAEVETARLQLEADEARYAAGNLSLIELLRSRDDHRKASQAGENGQLKAELAVLDLLVRSGSPIDAATITAAIPMGIDVDQPDWAGRILPQPIITPPLETALSALESDHPRVVRQVALLDAALAETSPPRDPVLSSVRLSLSVDNHVGTTSYSFARPSLSLAYTPPVYDIGTPLTSGSKTDDKDQNSVTLSAVFALNAGSSRAQTIAAADTTARYEAARLEIAIRSLEADIRAGFRRIASAEATLLLAEQALTRAEATLETVIVRDRLGMVTPAERAAADTAVDRARLLVMESRINLFNAQLGYIASAYLPEALPTGILETLPGGIR